MTVLPSYITDILSLYGQNGFKAYVVGGAARDIIMGKKPHDYDIATDATPDEGTELLSAHGIKTVDLAKRHGTLVAVLDDNNIEITTFRVEGKYEDHRHPSSVLLTRNIEDDVKRRDFTMNAVYIDENGEFVDLFGGMKDIEDGVIRAVGDPSMRFEEDALRILRALRFSAVLGFTIEEKTSEALLLKKDLLRDISPERITEELKKTVTGRYSPDVIRRYIDVFSVIIPELKRMEGFDQHSSYHDRDLLEHTLSVLSLLENREPDLCLAALLHDIGKPDVFVLDDMGFGHMKKHQEVSYRIALNFLEKYRFPNDEKKEIGDLVRLHDAFPETRSAVRRYLSEYSPEFMKKLSDLQRADIMSHSEKGRKRMDLLKIREDLTEEILRDNDCIKIKDLKISGDDIIGLGEKEGKKVGLILNDVFEKVIEGELKNDREELLLYVKSIL